MNKNGNNNFRGLLAPKVLDCVDKTNELMCTVEFNISSKGFFWPSLGLHEVD